MGFSKRTLTFFRQLARHNDKPWFEAHRDEYENDVRAPMRELIEELELLPLVRWLNGALGFKRASRR